MPVLTIGGEHSRGLGLKDMMAPVTADLRAVMVPDCGHYPQEEAPEKMLEAMLPFLKEELAAQ